MAVYYYKKGKQYSVFKNNKKIGSYSKGGYGIYAKILAIFLDKTGIKYKNYFKIDYKNNCVKMIIHSKKHGYKTVLFDYEDFERVKQIRWSIVKSKTKYTHYCKGVISKKPYKNILFHRYIMQYDGDLQIDHINKNGLDNRKCNLRIVSQSINQRNSEKRKANKCWTNVIRSGNAFQVHWRDDDMKLNKKFFKIKEFGEEEALRKAIICSIKMRYRNNYILTEKDKKFIKKNKLLLMKRL